MTRKVKLVMQVEVAAQAEAQARAVVTRIRSDLAPSIQHGSKGGEFTGVLPGTVGRSRDQTRSHVASESAMPISP